MPGETPRKVSGDCLYLNIWTPAKTVHEHLPVIVWIYGGLYQRIGFDAFVLGRPARTQGRNRDHHRVSNWPARFSRASGVDARVHASLIRELRFDGPDRRTRMDSEEYCGVWRRPEMRNHRRSILRSDIGQHSDGLPALAKGLFQRAIGESGGLFDPLHLAPKFLLANAERVGEKYALLLGAASLQELRRLTASQLTGNAGGICHR